MRGPPALVLAHIAALKRADLLKPELARPASGVSEQPGRTKVQRQARHRADINREVCVSAVLNLGLTCHQARVGIEPNLHRRPHAGRPVFADDLNTVFGWLPDLNHSEHAGPIGAVAVRGKTYSRVDADAGFIQQ